MEESNSPAVKRLDKRDRQRTFLGIALLISCVCLIVTILIISYFVYREIDHSALYHNKERINEKLKGDPGRATEIIETISSTRTPKTTLASKIRLSVTASSTTREGRSNRTSTSFRPTDRKATDKPSTDLPETNRTSTSFRPTDRKATDEPSSDLPETNRTSTSFRPTDRKATDEPSTDLPETNRTSTSFRPTDRKATDEPSTDVPETTTFGDSETSLKYSRTSSEIKFSARLIPTTRTEVSLENDTDIFTISTTSESEVDSSWKKIEPPATTPTLKAIDRTTVFEFTEAAEDITELYKIVILRSSAHPPAKNGTLDDGIFSTEKSVKKPLSATITALPTLTSTKEALKKVSTTTTKTSPTRSSTEDPTKLIVLTETTMEMDIKGSIDNTSTVLPTRSTDDLTKSILPTEGRVVIKDIKTTATPLPTSSSTADPSKIVFPTEKTMKRDIRPLTPSSTEDPSKLVFLTEKTTKKEPFRSSAHSTTEAPKKLIFPIKKIINSTTIASPTPSLTEDPTKMSSPTKEDLKTTLTTITTSSSTKDPTKLAGEKSLPLILKPTEKTMDKKFIKEVTSSTTKSSPKLTLPARTETPKIVTKIPEKDTIPKPPKHCETITCKRSASKMIAQIDHNIDPCEDFYQYACGGIEFNRMKNPQYDRVILEKLENAQPTDNNTVKFKEFYESCRKFNETEGLGIIMKTINDLFTVSKKLIKSEALTEVIAKILRLDPHRSNFGLLPLFDLTMEIDSDGLFIPTLTIPFENPTRVNFFDHYETYCINDLSSSAKSETNIEILYETYKKCVKNATRNISSIAEIPNELLDDLSKVDKTNLISKYLKATPDGISRRDRNEDIVKKYEKPVYFSLSELQVQYPEINWKTLMVNLFEKKSSKVSKVRVMYKRYLDKIFKFYSDNSLSDLTTFLQIQTMYDLYTEIIGQYETDNIKNYCLQLTINLMEDLATKLLLSKVSKKDLGLVDEKATDIFQEVKTQFKKSIENASWLVEPNKKIILSKLEKLQAITDTNNLLFNDPIIIYRNEKIAITDNFAENIINLKRNKRRLIYNKIDNNPGNVWLYEYNPLRTEIWTIPEQNKIIVTPALLSKLSFKKVRAPQQYEQFARLGFEIAKGIAEFFQPNQIGHLIPTIEDNEIFRNYLHIRLRDPEIAKMINVFDLIVSKEDLRFSENSRFSEDAAVRLALDSYRDSEHIKDLQFLWFNFTVSQLFYLSLSQEFCEPRNMMAEIAIKLYEKKILPNYFRVNSMIMNSQEFSEAFHCPLGSAMNPSFKADPFPYITPSEIEYT